MSASDDKLLIVKQWVEKAEEDFRTAEYTLTMPENCPYSTICFHCQQCVKKYIKAILIWRDIEFPRIHDIGELIDLLPNEIDLSLSDEEQERLSDYGVVVRYPMELEPIVLRDAETALALAKRVQNIASKFLSQIE